VSLRALTRVYRVLAAITVALLAAALLLQSAYLVSLAVMCGIAAALGRALVHQQLNRDADAFARAIRNMNREDNR
jgi:Flp pilus assembly protein TadB